MKNDSMQQNAKTYAALAAIALSGAFYLFAPAHAKDKIVGVVTFATAERQCFNFLKQYLVDPESGYVDSSYVESKEWAQKHAAEFPQLPIDPIFEKYDELLRVKAYAKNSMGGYVSVSMECPLVHGRFDEHAAFMRHLKR